MQFLDELEKNTYQAFQKCKLISEVFNEDIDNKILEALNKLDQNIELTIISYPYLFLRVTSWIAHKHYGEDYRGFWPNYNKELLNFNISDQNIIGKKFIKLISTNNTNLYNFNHLIHTESWKFVRIIVLHGGIPEIHLDAYFNALYKSFYDRNYTPEQFINKSYLPPFINNYFNHCKNYAREFFFNTLSLFSEQDISEINLPSSVKKAYLNWKENYSQEHKDLQRKLKSVAKGLINIGLNKKLDLCLIIENLSIPNEYSKEINLEIEGNSATFYFKIKGVDNGKLLLQKMFIPLSPLFIELLIQNKTLVITYRSHILGLVNLFSFDKNQLLFFKEHLDNYFISVKSNKYSNTKCILIPPGYSIDINNNLKDSIDIINCNNLYSILWYEHSDFLKEIIIYNELKEILNINLKINELENYNPLPFLFYKNEEVFCGCIDYMKSFKAYTIEKIKNNIKTLKNSIDEYGEYLIDKEKPLLFLPPINILKDYHHGKIHVSSIDENVLFNNLSKDVSIDIENTKPQIDITINYNQSTYTLSYLMPQLCWELSKYPFSTSIRNSIEITANSNMLENKYMLVKVINYPEIKKLKFGYDMINPVKIYKNLYKIKMNELMNTIENEKYSFVFLEAITDYSSVSLLKAVKAWMIYDVNYIIDEKFIKLEWKETIPESKQRAVRIWDYYYPWRKPIEYEIENTTKITLDNPGYKKILIEWTFLEEHDMFSVKNTTNPIMPLHFFDFESETPHKLEDLKQHEQFNSIIYDDIYSLFIRENLLSPEQLNLFLNQDNCDVNAFANYIVVDNGYSTNNSLFLLEYIREQTIDASNITEIANAIRYFDNKNLKSLLSQAFVILKDKKVDIGLYCKFIKDKTANNYISLIEEEYLDDIGYFLESIGNQELSSSQKIDIFKNCFLDSYWNSHEEMESFFNETESLLEVSDDNDCYSDEYSQVLIHYYKMLGYESENIQKEIYRKKLIFGHKFDSFEDYIKFFEIFKDLIDLPYIDELVLISLININNETHLGKYKYFADNLTNYQIYILKSAIDKLHSIQSINEKVEAEIDEIIKKIEIILLPKEDMFFEFITLLSNAKNTYKIKQIIKEQELSIFTINEILAILFFLSERKLLYKSSDFRKLFNMNDIIIKTYIDFYAMPESRKFLKNIYKPDQTGLQLLKLTAKQTLNTIDTYSKTLVNRRMISSSLIDSLSNICQIYRDK